MSSADLVISMGVDADRLSREMRAAERAAVRQAQDTQRQIEAIERASLARREARFQTFERSVALAGRLTATAAAIGGVAAGRALSEYQDKFPELATDIRDATSALDDFWESLGRDLSSSGFLEGLSDAIKKISEFRNEATNAVADTITLFGNGGLGLFADTAGVAFDKFLGFDTAASGRDAALANRLLNQPGLAPGTRGADIDAQRARAEDAAIATRQDEAAARLRVESRVTLLEAQGHPGEAAAARDQLALERLRDRLNEQVGRNELRPEQRDELLAAQERINAERQTGRDRDAAEFSGRMRENEETVARAYQHRLEASVADRRIQVERLRGHEEEAQRLERQRALEEQIFAVENDRTLSAERRRDLIERYQQDAAAVEEAIKLRDPEKRDRPGAGAVLGAGVASIASVRAVVFGGGGSPLESLGREQNKTLGQIKDTLQRIERAGPGLFTLA